MAVKRASRLLCLAAGCAALVACGGSDSSTDETSATPTVPATEPAPTDPPATEVPATEAPTTAANAAPALSVTDTGYAIDWSALETKPFFLLTVHSDPYYHIHTDADADGFFFSLELYVEYGPTWTGELGTFEISCSSASTGICAHFDPDGPGPLPDLGKDFLASGFVTINQLDEFSYDIVVDSLVFTDGTSVTGLHLVGSA